MVDKISPSISLPRPPCALQPQVIGVEMPVITSSNEMNAIVHIEPELCTNLWRAVVCPPLMYCVIKTQKRLSLTKKTTRWVAVHKSNTGTKEKSTDFEMQRTVKNINETLVCALLLFNLHYLLSIIVNTFKKNDQAETTIYSINEWPSVYTCALRLAGNHFRV